MEAAETGGRHGEGGGERAGKGGLIVECWFGCLVFVQLRAKTN